MPTYNYLCAACTEKHGKDCVFEAIHGMREKPEVKCPACGAVCERTWLGMTFQFFLPGEGLVRDKVGARRDMDLYTLQKNDPYAHMRQPGEVVDMTEKLRKGGKHQTNPKTIATHGLKK